MKLLLSCIALIIWAAAALAQSVPADSRSLSADRAAQREERLRSELLAARQAAAQEDWPKALREWQALYVEGNAEASGQLCRMYFDARQGQFDLSLVTQRCRRAAANGDAGALYRMGLLYLIGLGVDWNIDQARALCAAAQSATAQTTASDPDIAAGFCLAVIAQEDAKAAQAALRAIPASRPAADPGQPSAASPAQQCETSFTAQTALFAAAETLRSCSKAANAGDSRALYRVGLMKLMGLGGPRDLAQAEADCSKAQAHSAGRISAAFCLAAIVKLRRDAQSLALGRALGNIDSSPVTGLPLPKTEADPYLADRLLNARHRTDTGLEYTCRQIQQWARFEAPGLVILTPRDKLFGRKIVDYRPADFAALRDAAASCIATLAVADSGGTLRGDFTTFRDSLGALAARQATLRAAQPAGSNGAR